MSRARVFWAMLRGKEKRTNVSTSHCQPDTPKCSYRPPDYAHLVNTCTMYFVTAACRILTQQMCSLNAPLSKHIRSLLLRLHEICASTVYGRLWRQLAAACVLCKLLQFASVHGKTSASNCLRHLGRSTRQSAELFNSCCPKVRSSCLSTEPPVLLHSRSYRAERAVQHPVDHEKCEATWTMPGHDQSEAYHMLSFASGREPHK